MYMGWSFPVQYSIAADSSRNVSLEDMYVDLRVQCNRETTLPETLSSRDVAEMQRRMQYSERVDITQLFKEFESNAPTKVIILGIAGVGKTTLIKYVSKQWAESKLWRDEVKYLFVITLRQLRQNKNATLGELLLGGLSLTEDEKTAAVKLLHEEARKLLIVLEGMDEINFPYQKEIERDNTKEVEVNTLLSSIIDGAMLPGAKVIITSRPNDNVPVGDRTTDLYGFPKETIENYIHKFSGGDVELEKFITDYLQGNANIATLCYVPMQCNFVCVCISDMQSGTLTEDTPSIQTMTQLYVFATMNLARKLHPSLKNTNTQVDSKKIFDTVGNSLKNHAQLAMHCTMSTPQRIIIYEEDLDQFHICGVDKQTGFLAESVTRDLIASGLKRKCWTFNHLTFQEMFAAAGLLREDPGAILKLSEVNEPVHVYGVSNSFPINESFRRHAVLITFVTGMLCDPRNAYFMSRFEAVEDQLDPRTYFEKLAKGLIVPEIPL